jgi:hypothetical protein
MVIHDKSTIICKLFPPVASLGLGELSVQFQRQGFSWIDVHEALFSHNPFDLITLVPINHNILSSAAYGLRKEYIPLLTACLVYPEELQNTQNIETSVVLYLAVASALHQVTDINGNTPLHILIAAGASFPLIQLFVKIMIHYRGSDFLHKTNNAGQTPLCFALLQPITDAELVNLLTQIDTAQCLTSVDSRGYTSLHYAAEHVDNEALDLLIDACLRTVIDVDPSGEEQLDVSTL